MNKWQIGKLLDAAANIAVVVGVGLFALNLARPAERSAPARPAFAVGEAVPRLSEVDYAAKSSTVVLFMNSQCRFCTESMDFYRRLKSAIDSGRVDSQLVALSSESLPSLTGYLAAHQLFIPRHGSLARDEWSKLSGTPTLIVVDRQGNVANSWVGVIAAGQVIELEKALGAPGALD